MSKFEGFSKETIDFIWQLRFNNNKPWFEEHKPQFIELLQTPMKALAFEVFEKINADFGGRALVYKVSRIYKDARRVKGGEPYRTNLWFSIERPAAEGKEWTSSPVFWFELSAEDFSYGLGYYAARAETMAKLRARIDNKPKTFEKLIAPLNKQNEFVLSGAEYVRAKQTKIEKAKSWYNKKTISLIHQQPHDDILFSAELLDRVIAGYTFLMPFYDYFISLALDPSPKELSIN